MRVSETSPLIRLSSIRTAERRTRKGAQRFDVAATQCVPHTAVRAGFLLTIEDSASSSFAWLLALAFNRAVQLSLDWALTQSTSRHAGVTWGYAVIVTIVCANALKVAPPLTLLRERP